MSQINWETHSFNIKQFLNYIAAFLGIGTFLGIVNLVVGILSGSWLAVQMYGYLRYELPMKKMRSQLLEEDLKRRTNA